MPEGYFVSTSRTLTNWVVFRALDGYETLTTVRIYRLATAGGPAPNEFISGSGVAGT